MSIFNRYIVYIVTMVAMLLSQSCSRSQEKSTEKSLADSLCIAVQELRYRDSDKLHTLAIQLDSITDITDEQRSVATNATAYACFMAMDYERASELYASVIEDSNCEIERLTADVGMMLICYRTSANKEFFDFRSEALRRVRRINEEVALLPQTEKERFYAARVEMAAVSLCYFANLGMALEAEKAAEYLERNITYVTSPARRIYGAMLMNYRSEIAPVKRAESLITLLARAESDGEVWLSANARLMLAVLLRSDVLRETVHSLLPSQMKLLNVAGVSYDELPLFLAKEAAEGFSQYGDRYMMIEALSVAASCCTERSEFGAALLLLDDAMELVNGYYSKYYVDTVDELSLETAGCDSEWELMTNDDVANIYECLLSIRREASCAFAGVGDKYLSDINRNSYLDLLRTTRLNRQMESRIMLAEESASNLYFWTLLLFVMLVVASVVLYFFNVKWSRRSKESVEELNALLRLCRSLFSSLPDELSDDDANYVVASILNGELANFSGKSTFYIASDEDAPLGDNICRMPLATIDEPSVALYVETQYKIADAKMEFLQSTLPYIAAAIDEARRVADIGGERQRLQEKKLSYSLFLVEHKRENVDKRVALSLVKGMRPYMDRMLNELRHLADTDVCGEQEQRRLQYLSELTVVLDNYNEVLAQWIKMRHGELNLHIETFSLGEVLKIIAKSVPAFAMKGITLEVKDSDLVVKADKALTLFMINTLAENGGKFTPCGGKVAVEAIEGDDFVEVAVTDTGVGISPEDVAQIVNSKVYDASLIGRSGSMASSKGGGFGLMNCKGIIEKYRKTDELFSVCRLDIKSEPDNGSRFSFRLPKGLRRVVTMLLFTILPLSVSAGNADVNSLADSVYSCNVNGEYARALDFAQQLIDEMNDFYRENVKGVDTLSLSSGGSSELLWWRNALFADSLVEYVYYNLLDVRNEVAVAALAVGDWQMYRYNNSIYAQLYRFVHEDAALVHYYEKMQSVANYRLGAVVLCVTLLLVLTVVALVMYMRRIVVGKMNSVILLQMNKRLLNIIRGNRAADENKAQAMAREIYLVLRDYIKVECVSLLLDGEVESQSAAYPYDDDTLMMHALHNSGKSYVSADGTIRSMPLVQLSSGEHKTLGVLGVVTSRRLTETEIKLLELVAEYVASVVHHSIVRLAQEYRNLDEIEEETERVRFEENQLHVRNMVIDNCLSVIKHETIYYPGRIRELVKRLADDDKSPDDWCSKVASMHELMDYYHSVLGVLTSCATREIDDSNFKVARIDLSTLLLRTKGYAERRAVKSGYRLQVNVLRTEAVALGDSALVEYLFEAIVASLIALGVKEMRFSAVDAGEFVRVEVFCNGFMLGAERCASFFVPSADKSVTMEPLIAREIVRMHEDYMDRRAARLEAKDSEEGATIYFSLPK